MARFELDEAALARARRYLGLRRDVRVTNHAYENLYGRYIGLRRGVHRIGLDSELTPRDASQTLWHELTHALQAERLGGEKQFERAWFAEMQDAGLTRSEAARADGHRYNRTDMEREARLAERHHHLLPLARRKGRRT